MRIYIDDLRDPTRHLSEEQNKDILVFRSAREALKFLRDNSIKVEYIHLDHYLNDFGGITGEDILNRIALKSLGGDNYPNLKAIYLQTSEEKIADRLIEEHYSHFKENDIELIKDCQKY